MEGATPAPIGLSQGQKDGRLSYLFIYLSSKKRRRKKKNPLLFSSRCWVVILLLLLVLYNNNTGSSSTHLSYIRLTPSGRMLFRIQHLVLLSPPFVLKLQGFECFQQLYSLFFFFFLYNHDVMIIIIRSEITI